jgi:hypothetical protein
VKVRRAGGAASFMGEVETHTSSPSPSIGD